MRLRGCLDRSVGEWIRGIVETHGAEYCSHIIVVAKIGIKGGLFAEGKSGARGVQGVIRRSVVFHRTVSQAGDQFVGEAYTLSRPQSVAR